MADLSHFAKKFELHNRWNDLILKEFWEQGDKEIELGMPVSQFMNRHDLAIIPKNQTRFMEFIIVPLVCASYFVILQSTAFFLICHFGKLMTQFEKARSCLRGLGPVHSSLLSNYDYWSSKFAAQQTAQEPTSNTVPQSSNNTSS